MPEMKHAEKNALRILPYKFDSRARPELPQAMSSLLAQG